MVDVDLRRTPNRDAYEVVSQIEALAVLDRAAEESKAPAGLLGQALQTIVHTPSGPYGVPSYGRLLPTETIRAGAQTFASNEKALAPAAWYDWSSGT